MLGLINVLGGAIDNAAGSLSGDFADLLDKVKKIVDVVTTVIYIALAAFLVVKGALLGMAIVKAADEPQVRQEKIGSLKWLVIGVAIAYAVTFAADILTNYMKSFFA